MRPRSLAVILLAVLCVAPAQNPDHAGLQVSIAVPFHNGKRVIDYPLNSHFHVVISNVSGRRQRLWHPSSQAGWGSLVFEVTDAKGKTWRVRKKPKRWLGNYEAYLELEPRDSLVIDVELTKQDLWVGEEQIEGSYVPRSLDIGFPHASQTGELFTMRAIYQNPGTIASARRGVWVGLVASKEDHYLFRNRTEWRL